MKAESEGRDPWRRLQSPRFDGVSASGLELPRARVLGQVLQRGGGSRPVALTSEHYGRPLPLPVDSVRRSPLPVCSSPSSLGGGGVHFPSPSEPSWSQAGLSPLGTLCHPAPCHPPNLGFNVYFLIRMPATREPPGGPSVGRRGTGKSHICTPLSSPSQARGGPPQAGAAPSPTTTRV